MELHAKRLLLVPLGPDYLSSTHQYAGDIDNAKYMIHLPNVDVNETKSFLDAVQAEWQKCRPEFFEFAILLNNEHIGAVSIYIDQDTGEGELGWIINKRFWGNGYATEAARAVIDYAVQEWKLMKFIAHCDSENIGSYKVMDKLGMSFVSRSGGRRNKLAVEDSDELMYSLEIN
jgi:RimJ/RimL family protein N-acetyltransferase